MGGSPYDSEPRSAPRDYGGVDPNGCSECGGRYLPGLGVQSHRGLCSRRPQRGHFYSPQEEDRHARGLRSYWHGLADGAPCPAHPDQQPWFECRTCQERADEDGGW